MGQDVIHHGVDIVDIDRIGQAVTRWGKSFLERVFTPQELIDANGRTSSLAARFAAKEATAKALGAGIQGIAAGEAGVVIAVGWRDIEVVREPSGQPTLRLHGRAAGRATLLGWRSVALSLSHARDAAIASVVAIGTSDAGTAGASESRMVE